VGVVALLGGVLGSVTIQLSGRAPGPAFTLEGVERCTTGSLSLERLDCDPTSLKPSCSEIPHEEVTLRWDEQQSSVRLMGPTPGEERPVTVERRKLLLREFAALGRGPNDPLWSTVPPLSDIFTVSGKCDGWSLGPGPKEMFLRVDLVSALKAAELQDAPMMVVLSVRGPGPRAERLFRRIERLAR
jgi:hypothetical protein